MLKPERMSKLFVVGPKSRLQSVVTALHDLKIAHIIEHKKGEFDLCSPLATFEKTSGLLVQVRSVINHLGVEENSPQKSSLSLDEMEKQLQPIKEEVIHLIDQRKTGDDEQSKISVQRSVLDQMKLLNVSPQDFEKSEYITSYCGTIQKDIRSKIEHVTPHFELHTHKQEKNTLIALFVDSKHAEECEKVLLNASYTELDVSPTRELHGSAEECLNLLVSAENQLKSKQTELLEKLEGTKHTHGTFLSSIEKTLSAESEKAQCPLQFGSTQETFFMKCFLPKKDVRKVEHALQESADNMLHLATEQLGDEEEVPIKLNNARGIRNFEFFTKLYSLPSYNEFDPTILMAFTFPVFFGFMLGDVAYGLIMTALFLWMKSKFPVGKDFFNILIMAGISATIFGAIFGEILGFEPYQGLIVRTHDFDILMSIALLVGVVQVNFGLLLGFILEYKQHGLWDATTHKVSWVLIQIGGVLFILPLLGMLSFATQTPFYTGVVIFAIGVFLCILL